jgi:hypothetical protein
MEYVQSGLCPQPNVINASFRMWCEFGSKKAAAILGCLRVSRACAYTSMALCATHPHSAQAGLAFSNPPVGGTQIRPTLASGFSAAGGEARVQTLTASSVASATAFHHLLNQIRSP